MKNEKKMKNVYCNERVTKLTSKYDKLKHQCNPMVVTRLSGK